MVDINIETEHIADPEFEPEQDFICKVCGKPTTLKIKDLKKGTEHPCVHGCAQKFAVDDDSFQKMYINWKKGLF